jgi:hypothetical protein
MRASTELILPKVGFDADPVAANGPAVVGAWVKIDLYWVRSASRGVTRNRSVRLDVKRVVRPGDPAPLVDLFVRSARAAAECSRGNIARLKAMPDEWSAELRHRVWAASEALAELDDLDRRIQAAME